ncbi:MAG TPA: hypothetical protein VD995_20015 [Azospirillum sp.]|nr:hypothetical protein [Azospirillum sp.]
MRTATAHRRHRAGTASRGLWAWLAVAAVLAQLALPVQAVLAAAGASDAWTSICAAPRAADAPAAPEGQKTVAPPCPVCGAFAAPLAAPATAAALAAPTVRPCPRAVLPDTVAVRMPADPGLPPSRAPPAFA